jgi:uncharacterized membrane protein
VQARLLLSIFDSIYVFALTAWVGSILFFSFAVAPIIFKVLGAESGAKFVRALFPRYYAWGVVSTAIALPAMVCGPLSVPELRGPMVGVQAAMIAVSLGIMLYCGNTLTPAINAARDEGPASADRFNRLHKRSVNLNAVVLLIGIVLLVGFAVRRTPRTPGIEETTPQEGVEYDREFSEALNRIIREQDRRDASAEPGRFRLDEAARKELEGLVEAKRRKANSARP